MRLSICIVSWNTKNLLDQCLSSVFSTIGDLDAEVIVVDNASSDGSPEMVREKYPPVRLMTLDSNTGFSHANNRAFYESWSKYFLLLNSDTIVLPNALQSLVDFMENHPDAGAVGCKLLNGDGSLQRSCSPFPTPLTELFDALYLSKMMPGSRIFGRYAMSYWDFSSVQEVDFAGGSCLCCRRQAMEQVGPLDEGFFMYSEEADLCYRLRKGGWKVYFTPEVSIIHLGGESSKLDVKRTLLDLYRSKYRFMMKHYGFASAAAYRGVVFVSSLARAAAWGLRSLSGEYRDAFKKKAAMQARLVSWAIKGR